MGPNHRKNVPQLHRRSSLKVDEREAQIRADYEWCLHSSDVQQAYAGKVVAVHRQRIWGVGKNHQAAVKAALGCAGCPPQEQLALVFVEGRTSCLGA